MSVEPKKVSAIDELYIKEIRTNVASFIEKCGQQYDNRNRLVLDVAPQDHEGAKPYFPKAQIETLDIDKESGATYIADLCKNNHKTIPSCRFDFVVCTEVLEHTLQPFNAVNEIERILKPGGMAFVSTPFNFRIHGPLPDCWRFTEHGLRALFTNFEIVSLKTLEDKERFLMPIHHTLVVKKRAPKDG
jgi:SAM-dependent methyltransferase